MALHLIQTSDERRYRPMLEASARVSRAWCLQRGYGCTVFAGRKRGQSPVHAAYNRFFMLHELMQQGHRDWVLYMDADAWIQDMDFDVEAYLAEHGRDADFIAAEASRHIQHTWCINNGVFFIHLGREVGRSIAALMHHLVNTRVPAEHWDNPQAGWAPEEYDDQNMLYGVLAAEHVTQGRIRKESGEVFNYRGRFIAQCLRTDFETLDERIDHVRAATDDVLLRHRLRLGERAPVTLDAGAPPRLSLLLPRADAALCAAQALACSGLPAHEAAQLELLAPDTAMPAGRTAAAPWRLLDGAAQRSAGLLAQDAAALARGDWLLLAAPGRCLAATALARVLRGLDALRPDTLYQFGDGRGTAPDAVLIARSRFDATGGLPDAQALSDWPAVLAALATDVRFTQDGAAPLGAITNVAWIELPPLAQAA